MIKEDGYTIYIPATEKGKNCQFPDYYSVQQMKNIELNKQKKESKIDRLGKELELLRNEKLEEKIKRLEKELESLQNKNKKK